VLELIYHSAVFGPIHFEYEGPVVRIGSSEDNDLVLRHPSVEPHHCVLVFRGEKVICLPPDAAVWEAGDRCKLDGTELGMGDEIQIGDLRLSLAHSARSVAIPEARTQAVSSGAGESGSAAGAKEGPGQAGYFCTHCRVFIPQTQVNRVGLVGRAKRCLCPKCSSVLDSEPDQAMPAPKGRKRR